MIDLDLVSKQFGDQAALAEVTFSVSPGVTGLLGPNGAGKTTALRLIAGFMAPTRGTVRVQGRDPLRKETRREIGYLAEGAPLPPDLTVSEILRVASRIRGISRTHTASELQRVMEPLGLMPLRHRSAEVLSKGQRRRVALAGALVGNPSILVLDEPTDGLDPNQRDEVHAMIRQWSPDRTVLISTHILDEAERLCDYALILANGRLVAEGAPRELCREPAQEEIVRIDLVEARDVHRLGERLAGLETVMRVESIARQSTLVVVAQPGRRPFAEIAALISAEGWSVHGIYRHTTRLDERFRALTLTEPST